jgi:hypothetical protein
VTSAQTESLCSPVVASRPLGTSSATTAEPDWRSEFTWRIASRTAP